jgi:hypothetical protein
MPDALDVVMRDRRKAHDLQETSWQNVLSAVDGHTLWPDSALFVWRILAWFGAIAILIDRWGADPFALRFLAALFGRNGLS